MTSTATNRALSSADVRRLLSDSSAQARMETVSKLVADLENGSLAGPEKAIATDILHKLAMDAEASVRESVAWQIHNSPLLTDTLAARLARDIGRVAFPVLRNVARLTDDLLLQVIADHDAEKQLAIAGRQEVSPSVADAIVETDNVRVITRLLRNDGATIADATLHKALDRYGILAPVNEAAASRSNLSLEVIGKLIGYVSDEIKASLVERHRLSPVLVAEMVERGREAATILLMKPLADSSADLQLAARQLDRDGRLSPTMMLRALCAGETRLFTIGLGVRAGISAESARLLVWDDGPLGLRAVFEKAKFPMALLPPFRVAIEVVKELAYGGGDAGREDYQVAVLARVFEECGAIEDRMVDDLLLQLFDQKSDEVIERAMERAGMPFHPMRAAH
ncbi:hypothetical protein N825_06120 [Skermanella stibiiresistens SB22]|uniref:DUF2336 domain-containing protein n=1 Tax=Skermanella stibiiresistens SB22 TaxID=1385369 RepID=W9H7A4_9PROT|nr:DUF2336 domain-containing protein [Skermanella stibiiresistens]EWY39658.1 hypothetical protein N825_06120 [Skermanella stibiiresistens SB22]